MSNFVVGLFSEKECDQPGIQSSDLSMAVPVYYKEVHSCFTDCELFAEYKGCDGWLSD